MSKETIIINGAKKGVVSRTIKSQYARCGEVNAMRNDGFSATFIMEKEKI